jgi:hypothetical protein
MTEGCLANWSIHYPEVMDIIELKNRTATVVLTEAEVKMMNILTQYWIEELPSNDPGTQQLSDQLRELACRSDIH